MTQKTIVACAAVVLTVTGFMGWAPDPGHALLAGWVGLMTWMLMDQGEDDR